MCRRLAVLASVAFLLLWPAESLASSASRSVRVTTRTDGIKLSLILARHMYPRNALVLATMRLRNVSNASVLLPSPCPPGAFLVQVVTPAGRMVYPPALRSQLPTSCPPPPPEATVTAGSLPPAGVVQVRVPTILRAPRLRAVAELGPPGGVTGRFLHIRLTRGDPPQVQLRLAPVEAVITPRKGEQSGPLYYDAWAICQARGPTGLTYPGAETGWKVLRHGSRTGYLLRPQLQAGQGCNTPVQWHLVAGFLNQPVACVDYVSASLPPWMRSGVIHACSADQQGA